MATPLSRRPEAADEPAQTVATGRDSRKYLLTATGRDTVAQAAVALGLLTGLWVALSPFYITLQRVGTNANVADLIVGLVVAGIAAVTLASRRGFGGLEMGALLLGVWVIVSSFILDARVPIATPMFWSNTFAGAVLVILAAVGLSTLRPATR
jgi:hypothetical protein